MEAKLDRDIRQEEITWPSPGWRHSYGCQLFLVCQRLLFSTLKILLAKKCPSLVHWDGWLPSGCSGYSHVSPARALSMLWEALLRKNCFHQQSLKRGTHATQGLGSVLSWVTHDLLMGSMFFTWQPLPSLGRPSYHMSIQFIMSRRALLLMSFWLGGWLLACCPAERAPCHCDRWIHVLACCGINRSSKYESNSLESDFETHAES